MRRRGREAVIDSAQVVVACRVPVVAKRSDAASSAVSAHWAYDLTAVRPGGRTFLSVPRTGGPCREGHSVSRFMPPAAKGAILTAWHAMSRPLSPAAELTQSSWLGCFVPTASRPGCRRTTLSASNPHCKHKAYAFSCRPHTPLPPHGSWATQRAPKSPTSTFSNAGSSACSVAGRGSQPRGTRTIGALFRAGP